MPDQYGYAGRILRIDLSSGKITTTPSSDYADKYLGGRGFAARIYWEEAPPGAGAFDPENVLVFALGPMAGTPLIGSSRWQVCGKSPQTMPEQFSYCNMGGSWGAQLKFAGYDAVVVSGKSEKPVYLSVNDDRVELKDASHIWGKTSVEAREAVKQELGSSVRVVTMGPAGENLVPFAILFADNDAAGTSGFGAVMGSKNLKAVAVKGSGKAHPADPDRLLELCSHFRDLKKGWEDRWAEAPYKTSMRKIASKLKKDLCYGCIGACNRTIYTAGDGTKGKYMCGAATFYSGRAQNYYKERNDVPFFATKACDYYGVDSDVILVMTMWLSRCAKSGVLTDENTGIPLSKMGSLEFIQTLIRKIALRDGFGDVLAQGVHKAAKTVGQGTEAFITDYTLKSGNYSAYCPRQYIVNGMIYAIEPRQPIQQLHEIGTTLFDWVEWATKVKGAYCDGDVLRKIAVRFWGSEAAADFSTYEGKALAAARIQDRQYAKESLILCDNMWPVTYVAHSEDHVGDPSLESKVLSAAIGKTVTEQELYTIGERIFNLQRAIHVRDGRGAKDADTLPEAFFTMPLKTGAENAECLAPGKDGEITSRKGAVVDRAQFAKMRDEFYQLRGWDVATGLQTTAKLRELGLDDVAQDLSERGLAKP